MADRHLSVIDLFAGAGGFGLGFEMAGYELLASLELDKWACETLKHNHPDLQVIEADIRSLTDREQIRSMISSPPDVVIGGPPCQGFSVAGPARKDPSDPRNSLFVEFALWVEALRPSAIIMENVKGLLSRRNADGERVIEIIGDKLRSMGYTVEVWLLNAADYGIPQNRERVLIVGTQLDHPIGPPPITHARPAANGSPAQPDLFSDGKLEKPLSLWGAISDLPRLGAGEGEEEQPHGSPARNEYQMWARSGSTALFNHVAMNHSKRIVERFKHVTWGSSAANVPEEHLPRTRNGQGKVSKAAYDQNNRRLNPDKPSHTIAASFYANFIHPYQHRNLTAREGARIQSFPDDYRFMGKPTVVSHKLLQREGRLDEKHLCQYNQIGNAVPPLLAKSIAGHLKGKAFD